MKQFHGLGLLNEMLRFLADLKPEPLFEANGSKDPGGIFHEAEAVKDPNDSVLDVPPAPEKVQKFTGRPV